MNRQEYDSPFQASGRFGRLSYLAWTMLMSIAAFTLILIIVFFSSNSLLYDNAIQDFSIIGAGLMIIVYIALIYVSFIFTIRRLHDRNHSGWLSLVMLIPLINLLLMIYLTCAKGNDEANHYGSPRMTQGWEKVLGWLYILIFPLVMIAAVALPSYQSYIERTQYTEIQQQVDPTE